MRYAAGAILLGALVAAPQAARAWDDEGHRVVALIAEHYLSPATRDKVTAMLAADTDTLTAHDIASAANWADKYADSDKRTTKERYERTWRWHFADIEAARPNIPEACFGYPPLPAGTPASQGPAKACIIDKIAQFSDELAAPGTSDAERLVALKFLLNLVGDIHQPLRVADENNNHGASIQVSAETVTAGDLFDYWDIAFVNALDPNPETLAKTLISHITDEDRRLWASVAPQLWALEAHQLGVDHAYGMLDSVDPNGHFALQPKQVDRAVETDGVQLSRAGVRLAYVLETALTPAVAAKPEVIAGSAKDGHDFAQTTCTTCHIISADQKSPPQFTTAPDFPAIANTKGVNATALAEFLTGAHPTMPTLALSQKQADDVIAFILTYRKH